MGSVKDLVVDEPASATALGAGRFRFSDRYSVFDWGEMPDHVDGKGASLCLMGAENFELLEDEGVATHYRGVVPPDTEGGQGSVGDAVALADADAPPRSMAVDLAQVPELPFEDGGYDYEAYHDAGGENAVIPLEVVYRNSVPIGSSLRDRRSPDEVDLALDGEGWPDDEHVALDEPIVEFSTKYEEQDRYLDEDEARRISGLDDDGFAVLRGTAEEVNRVVTERADDVGLSHQDGKIECVVHGDEILVADVVGTFDENRFLRDGQQLSKEFLRQFYKQYDPEWVEAVGDAKRAADEQGLADWRELCDVEPEPLPEEVASTASDLYRSGANRYVGEDWFEAPPLDDVVDRIGRTRPA